MVTSFRPMVVPSCVLAGTLVLGASAGWSGPASGILAALVAILVAVISAMLTTYTREEGPRDG